MFVKTYFTKCCLLKMKILGIKFRRMLTLFVKQERELNCWPRNYLLYTFSVRLSFFQW